MKKEKEKSSSQNDKIEIPIDIQKSMMEFFLKTSIPRIKANKLKNSLSEKKETGE
jgi:hypothetical protein